MINAKLIILISGLCILLSCNAPIEKVSTSVQVQLDSIEKSHQMVLNNYENITLIHTVYFWLKEDLDADEIAHFEKWVGTLSTCPTVSRFRMGKPASTEKRDVVDNSYSYAINVEFVDQEAQAAYQVDSIHLKFIEKCKDLWEKVIVYDNTVM